MMHTSELSREIIKAFETCMLAVPGRPGYFTTYRDDAGVLTVGYGHTNFGGVPPHITPGVVLSQQMCDQALSDDLLATELDVFRILQNKCPAFTPNQHQWDALISFQFNTGHLEQSSIPPKLQEGNLTGAVETLKLYVHAGGKVLNGLIRRRQCEAFLFEGDIRNAASLADLHIQQPIEYQVQTATAIPDRVNPEPTPEPAPPVPPERPPSPEPPVPDWQQTP